MYSKTTWNHLERLDRKCDKAVPGVRVRVSDAEFKAMQRALDQKLAAGYIMTPREKDACIKLGLTVRA